MTIELLLSKIGIYDVEPNRRSAVRRMINSASDAVWYLDDQGHLTWVSRNPAMARSLASALPRYINSAQALAVESGFQITQVPKHSLTFSSLRITRHSLQRWEERCNGLLPTLDEIRHSFNRHVSSKIVNNESPTGEFFIPLEAGALVGLHTSTLLTHNTVSEVKQRSFQGNYQWNPKKRTWVGEFPRLEIASRATTFLGWEELRRGGAFSGSDWQKKHDQDLINSENLQRMIREHRLQPDVT